MSKYEVSHWDGHATVEAEGYRVIEGAVFFITGTWQVDHNVVQAFSLAQTIWWKKVSDD